MLDKNGCLCSNKNISTHENRGSDLVSSEGLLLGKVVSVWVRLVKLTFV